MKGVKTVRQTARWLRGRWGQQVMILGYHLIAELSYDPYGIAIRPSHFAEQMDILRREAQPISLAKAYKSLQTGNLPRRAVVVTFDDGYKEVLLRARPLLVQFDIPATTFVVAGCLGQELWWDELVRIIFSPVVLPDQLQLNVNGRLLTWSMFDPQQKQDLLRKQAPTPRRRLLLMLYEALLAQPEVRSSVLSELHTWSLSGAKNHELRKGNRVMSPTELADLTSDGLVEMGSHTMTHATLALLSSQAQSEEIRQSKVLLEEITGRPVTSFSYPHGSVSAATKRLVQESGYSLACASYNGLAWRNSNPFSLPRFWPPDWGGETFSRWLRWWLHG